MWPEILEAVKDRRRFTWILLSQNAQVSGFDGTTLQIGFPNAGARDSFANGGSEDVLKDVLAERFQVQWRVEAIVDPSGGANPPAGGAPAAAVAASAVAVAASVAERPPRRRSPHPRRRPGRAARARPSPPAGSTARVAPAAARVRGWRGKRWPLGVRGGGQGGAPAAEPSYTPEPPPMSIEYDMPAEDDPDLVDSALSGHDLIVRELGATVVEEFNNE
ncbi:hypothetical protein [Streptomyces sirii]|uniref:hypothetical protein n=1 Tax=Streptomyces sirii TaxID=3127701 RepID=UPI003D35D930